MNLEIVKKSEGFIVQDENGVEYGPRTSTVKNAEEVLESWKAYYSGPETTLLT